jgi:multiple sugar transport system permease protein
MLTSSLKSARENITFPPNVIFTPTLDNFAGVLARTDVPAAIGNSLLVGGAATAIALVFGLPAAYGIARYRLRGLATGVLLARMLPGIALLLPWFIMFRELGIVGTHWALILSHLSVTLPLVVWLSVGFFEDLPAELIDAAAVDGCSTLQVLTLIALPLARSGIAAAAILAFVHSWNVFLYSLVLGGTIELAPVAAFNQIREFETNWGGINAAAVLTTWPIILLALPFSRALVRGLSAGATKG